MASGMGSPFATAVLFRSARGGMTEQDGTNLLDDSIVLLRAAIEAEKEHPELSDPSGLPEISRALDLVMAGLAIERGYI